MLYYAAGPAMGRQMMSVTIKSDQGFEPGNPKPLFKFQNAGYDQLRNHDLHPNGDRFLIVAPAALPEDEQLVYVSNWLDEVERLVPTAR
jgi:hypothetical protein